MTRQHDQRSHVNGGAGRPRPILAKSQPGHPDRQSPARPGAEETALAFLSDVLIGDSTWTMAEVRQLVWLRESAELGRWRCTEPDDEGAGAG
jgi:hypothetical protein